MSRRILFFVAILATASLAQSPETGAAVKVCAICNDSCPHCAPSCAWANWDGAANCIYNPCRLIGSCEANFRAEEVGVNSNLAPLDVPTPNPFADPHVAAQPRLCTSNAPRRTTD